MVRSIYHALKIAPKKILIISAQKCERILKFPIYGWEWTKSLIQLSFIYLSINFFWFAVHMYNLFISFRIRIVAEDDTSVATFVLLNFEAEKLLKWFNDKTKWGPTTSSFNYKHSRGQEICFSNKIERVQLYTFTKIFIPNESLEATFETKAKNQVQNLFVSQNKSMGL